MRVVALRAENGIAASAAWYKNLQARSQPPFWHQRLKIAAGAVTAEFHSSVLAVAIAAAVKRVQGKRSVWTSASTYLAVNGQQGLLLGAHCPLPPRSSLRLQRGNSLIRRFAVDDEAFNPR